MPEDAQPLLNGIMKNRHANARNIPIKTDRINDLNAGTILAMTTPAALEVDGLDAHALAVAAFDAPAHVVDALEAPGLVIATGAMHHPRRASRLPR